MTRIFIAVLILSGIIVAPILAESTPSLQVWAVDPLIKVFRDTQPPAPGTTTQATAAVAMAEVARGEHATLQFVVRSGEPVSDLRVAVTALRSVEATATMLQPRPARSVGYVPVPKPSQKPAKEPLRKTPADFPDPLLEDASITLPAQQSQPVWITVPIPVDAAPSIYRGQARLTYEIAGQKTSLTFPLTVRVYPALIKSSRLWVTNWFSIHSPHMKIHPKAETPEYYDLMRRFARNMADHRQNVALISPLSLATYTARPDGTLDIDFTRFDRHVQVFIDEGVIGRIEGGHIGGRKSGWISPFVVTIHQIKDGKVQAARVDPGDPAADQFYAQFFPALVKHLREKGWLDRYMQHLADEPVKENIAGYNRMAKLARQYAPELKTIEACHTKDLVGSIDVWVPQLNFWHDDYQHYLNRQKAGDQVWFYTCVFPQGEYANRFIEQHLIKTRLLHWINYKYGATGYLHWGYNHWTAESPFTHTLRPHGGPPYLPAGDAWIVYPGQQGPLDSIRHEAMRDGIADHELLCQLAEKNPEAAKRLADRHVLSFDRYDINVETFRETRRELLTLLGK